MTADEQTSQLGRIGRYELLEFIASGGMGAVYLACQADQSAVAKLLAIKVLLPEYAGNQRFVEMFIDEAKIAARLDHPNICKLFELGVDDGRPFIVME